MRVGLRVALSGALLTIAARDAHAQQACTAPKTSCQGHGGYYASSEDRDRVTGVTDPILRELRACLDASGGKQATPAVRIRWDADGKAVEVKSDIPGYDSLPCVQKAVTKLQNLQNPHETAMRCEYGCAKPAAPAPTPAPVVVPPPAPATTAPEAAPAVAPAASPAPPVIHPVRYEKHWYGWQTLIADGTSIALFLGGLGSDTKGLTTTGYLGFLFVTPIIHWAHANVGPGFGSLAIRVLLPPVAVGVGAIVGLAAAGTSGNGDLGEFLNDSVAGWVMGAGIGGLIGIAGCVAIDAAGLAYTKERVDDQSASSKTRPWFTLAPNVDIRQGRSTFGLGGTF